MSQEQSKSPEEGMSGARADFIAALGRKVVEARDLLGRIEANVDGTEERGDLAGRLQSLGTAARLLHFSRVAQALAQAQATLEQAAGSGGVSFKSLEAVGRILDDLPALAWDPESLPDATTASGPAPSPADGSSEPSAELPSAPIGVPLTVLVVGPDSLAELVLEEAESRSARNVEVERTDDVGVARSLARSLAPDVLVLDGAVAAGDELVEALAEDPLTEPVPIIVVGALTKQGASRFLALGVQRTLVAPYSGEVLLRTCEEVVDQRFGRTARLALGDPTVEQLGQRLADEVYRALVTGIAPSVRAQHVSLGEGTEVLAAVWGAIARVREIVTVRTGGAVRFVSPGPEGATALAPWLDPDIAGADRMRVRGRGAGADVRLEGRRVVVADDDPGVTWYISDLLRTTGCVVYEALDGRTALALAHKTSPDLVISDILMPQLDGFGLCRSLHRDVALRDVPVILLSWKEDLLQRVRELGASAAAYLRKETDARAILARVREVLWPRARLEARLKGTGEVRGRIEGITVCTLLQLVGLVRQNARVSIRDASSLFEVELRQGTPRRVTLTSGDGGFLRGERALAAMLGVGAGRFVVGPASSGTSGELSGSLQALLEQPIASARGALAAVSGAKGVVAARVVFDVDALESYLHATPEPMRALVLRLAQGASPRELLLGGVVAPSLLEDVLSDLAARGAITGVADEGGADLLGPEIAAALDVLKSAPPRPATTFSSLRASRPPSRPPARAASAAPPPSGADQAVAAHPVAPPSSLADAVMRELAERAPGSGRPAPPPAPIVEPAALRPRSNPPEGEAAFELCQRPVPSTPVLEQVVLDDKEQHPSGGEPSGLDATDVAGAPVAELVRPLPGPVEEPTPSPPATPSPTEIDAVYEAEPMTPSAGFCPTPADEVVETASAEQDAAPDEIAANARPGEEAEERPLPDAAESEREEDASEPEDAAPTAEVRPKRSSTGLVWFLLLAVLLFGGLVVKLAMTSADPSPGAYVDVPAGEELRGGEGILQVRGAGEAEVVVDGSPRGRGPDVRMTLAAGAHDVRVGERPHHADVRAGRMLVLDVSVP